MSSEVESISTQTCVKKFSGVGTGGIEWVKAMVDRSEVIGIVV